MSNFEYREYIMGKLIQMNIELEGEVDTSFDLYIRMFTQIAHDLKDYEVLGLATSLQKKYVDKFSSFEYDPLSDDFPLEQYFPYHQVHVENNFEIFCRQIKDYIYGHNDFRCDMGKYQNAANQHREELLKRGLYDKLAQYVDEKFALERIYQRVKKHLSKRRDTDGHYITPTIEEVKAAFTQERDHVYRLADKHLENQLGYIGVEFE